MRHRGHDQAQVTRELGCATGVVSRWIYCDRRPSTPWPTKIEEVYGVPASAWGREPTERWKLRREAA